MRRAGRFEKGAKLPLDFTHRIRYNKYRSKNDAPVCRNGRRGGLKIPCANNTCGFDPHHRHKKEAPQLVWGVSFLSAACEWVEQHGPALQGERSALRAVAQCAGDPHHRHKKGTPPACLGEFFYLPAACEWVEQHGPDKECSGNANRPHLPDRMVYRSGNGAVHFLCGSFCFLSAASLARADSSVPPYSAPAKGRFCPPYLWPQRLPAFPGMAACFAERSYYTREKNIEILLRPFILLFLTVFTMFFAKKALQMNFKNILYNHKFNFFTQIVSFRFVWGSEVCAFRAASALR